jgi:hypothetical protein
MLVLVQADTLISNVIDKTIQKTNKTDEVEDFFQEKTKRDN